MFSFWSNTLTGLYQRISWAMELTSLRLIYGFMSFFPKWHFSNHVVKLWAASLPWHTPVFSGIVALGKLSPHWHLLLLKTQQSRSHFLCENRATSQLALRGHDVSDCISPKWLFVFSACSHPHLCSHISALGPYCCVLPIRRTEEYVWSKHLVTGKTHEAGISPIYHCNWILLFYHQIVYGIQCFHHNIPSFLLSTVVSS